MSRAAPRPPARAGPPVLGSGLLERGPVGMVAEGHPLGKRDGTVVRVQPAAVHAQAMFLVAWNARHLGAFLARREQTGDHARASGGVEMFAVGPDDVDHVQRRQHRGDGDPGAQRMRDAAREGPPVLHQRRSREMHARVLQQEELHNVGRVDDAAGGQVVQVDADVDVDPLVGPAEREEDDRDAGERPQGGVDLHRRAGRVPEVVQTQHDVAHGHRTGERALCQVEPQEELHGESERQAAQEVSRTGHHVSTRGRVKRTLPGG
mmetsp:Transcript_91507/g.259112  ORF Transcript_91507/g.259112 Transcript_91507/m.259112 type:complete len:263 (-) Transcript_91507:67-855(-)